MSLATGGGNAFARNSLAPPGRPVGEVGRRIVVHGENCLRKFIASMRGFNRDECGHARTGPLQLGARAVLWLAVAPDGERGDVRARAAGTVRMIGMQAWQLRAAVSRYDNLADEKAGPAPRRLPGGISQVARACPCGHWI